MNPGLAGRLARLFTTSKLTPLAVLTSLLVGILALSITPREEEPQIIVPMVDVRIPYPGASPREVEQRITIPVEKLLWGLPDVEYVYSTSRHAAALILRLAKNVDHLARTHVARDLGERTAGETGGRVWPRQRHAGNHLAAFQSGFSGAEEEIFQWQVAHALGTGQLKLSAERDQAGRRIGCPADRTHRLCPGTRRWHQRRRDG